MQKITKKCYYRISFLLESSLMLGSGENIETDQDILKDKKGQPYIPASGVAGVARSLFSDEARVKQYFGSISPDGNNRNSRLVFYDAHLVEEDRDKAVISIRDSVKLDQYKTAVKGAKFDAEVLEPGVHFVTWIELNLDDTEKLDSALPDEIAEAWLQGELRFGAKTMRGYGATRAEEVLVREFDLTDKKSTEEWLDFDMYRDSDWRTEAVRSLEKKGEANNRLLLSLRQRSGLSVQSYTTDLPEQEKDGVTPLSPDSGQLTLADGTPVIPGTSWAGVFRHRMYALVPSLERQLLFGEVGVNNNTGAVPSQIRFSETKLAHAKFKRMSHNAINRFSGAVEDTALFTEQYCYNGETTLCISWTKKLGPEAKAALAAAVADLHYGYLTVGGLTGIGRGFFEVTAVNGNPVTSEKLYQQILQQLNRAEEKTENTKTTEETGVPENTKPAEKEGVPENTKTAEKRGVKTDVH
ncbi:MAG: RAMP superfamily CRISPR-associated protein [Lachnospiraceae bacterium]|nr:RAMP superfamily CRISPR-associated protein [Lachnospiraceae bacterium]